MSDDAIKAALVAASREICFGPDGEDCDKCMVPATCKQPSLRVRDAAAAIAAFLDAMNPHNRRAGFNLARAVEEAAAIRRAGGAA